MYSGVDLPCPSINLNTQSQENEELTKNVASWSACSELCRQKEGCKAWTWAHKDAGQWALNCVTMTGYGYTNFDTNVVSGGRDCEKIIVGGTPIGQGNLLATLPTWGPTFRLTLDLYIHSFAGSGLNNGFAELVRLTSTDNNCCAIGDRIPAIFTHKNGHLHIGTQIGSRGNQVKNVNLAKRKWHRLELVQYAESSKVACLL